jgi:heme-degrading monooxygenase HmoA
MIARIWRTKVDFERLAAYEHFAQHQSLPMFQQQYGFLGVFFLRGYQDCTVLSLWADSSAVEALATSTTYQATTRQLQATGLLLGQPFVELFEVSGNALLPEVLSQRGEQHGSV